MLHVLLPAIYFLPLVLNTTTVEMLRQAPVAVLNHLLRLLLFDPVLNLASGSPIFAVDGTTATDRLLRCLAPGHPKRLRLVVWVVSLFIMGYILIIRK